MKKNIRIIPRLDIKGDNLVKGIHLEGLRVLGKPEIYAKHYYEHGADELIYIDVVASLYGRNNLLDIVNKTAKEIFIPLTVGGGIRTLKDIEKVLNAGADKVSLNTKAINNPNFVKKASRKFGSSTIVISIEAIKNERGNYEAFTNNGREITGVDAIKWAKEVETLGAGEILLTSIDFEGTGKGFDIELINKISSQISIPVIASGGAGNLKHVFEVINQGKADGVALASILHYNFLRKYRKNFNCNYESEGNIEFLKSNKTFSKVKDEKLRDIKNYLFKHDIDIRI